MSSVLFPAARECLLSERDGKKPEISSARVDAARESNVIAVHNISHLSSNGYLTISMDDRGKWDTIDECL